MGKTTEQRLLGQGGGQAFGGWLQMAQVQLPPEAWGPAVASYLGPWVWWWLQEQHIQDRTTGLQWVQQGTWSPKFKEASLSVVQALPDPKLKPLIKYYAPVVSSDLS